MGDLRLLQPPHKQFFKSKADGTLFTAILHAHLYCLNKSICVSPRFCRINLDPLTKDTSLYVLCRSFIHNDLHKRKVCRCWILYSVKTQRISRKCIQLTHNENRNTHTHTQRNAIAPFWYLPLSFFTVLQLPERPNRLASFSQETDKFALLLKAHPPTVTSVPQLRGRKHRTLRTREILNSARNMPSSQLLRAHLAYCRELKRGCVRASPASWTDCFLGYWKGGFKFSKLIECVWYKPIFLWVNVITFQRMKSYFQATKLHKPRARCHHS